VRGVISSPWCAREAMSDFQHVSGLDCVSALCPSPVLSRQESGDSPGDSGVVGTPATPVDCIAIVGAAPPLHFDVPLNRRLGVAASSRPMGSRLEVPLPLLAPPVLLVAPFQGLARMAKPAPRAEWLAQLCVPLLECLVTADRGVGVAPAAAPRIQRRNEACLGNQPRSAHHCPDLSLMTCPRFPARLDNGLVAALGLRGVLPKVEAQEVTPGLTLLGVQGMGDAGFARFQGHSPAASVFRQDRLPALDHFTPGM
jgi:hypothetical protein